MGFVGEGARGGAVVRWDLAWAWWWGERGGLNRQVRMSDLEVTKWRDGLFEQESSEVEINGYSIYKA